MFQSYLYKRNQETLEKCIHSYVDKLHFLTVSPKSTPGDLLSQDRLCFPG